MGIDYNQDIRERGINCVYQSWGANAFVPDGNKWLFGFYPPIRNAEDSKVAMQGRIRLQRYDTVKGEFFLSNGDRQPPTVATGDSGGPVLCAHGSQDPLYAGRSGQGIMFLVLTSGFCYQVEEYLRERGLLRLWSRHRCSAPPRVDTEEVQRKSDITTVDRLLSCYQMAISLCAFSLSIFLFQASLI